MKMVCDVDGACILHGRNGYEISVEEPEAKILLGKKGVNGRVILK
jgi:hypothetical protein